MSDASDILVRMAEILDTPGHWCRGVAMRHQYYDFGLSPEEHRKLEDRVQRDLGAAFRAACERYQIKQTAPERRTASLAISQAIEQSTHGRVRAREHWGVFNDDAATSFEDVQQMLALALQLVTTGTAPTPA